MVRESLGAAGSGSAMAQSRHRITTCGFSRGKIKNEPSADAPRLSLSPLPSSARPSDHAFVSSGDAGRLVENVDNSIHTPFSNVDVCA